MIVGEVSFARQRLVEQRLSLAKCHLGVGEQPPGGASTHKSEVADAPSRGAGATTPPPVSVAVDVSRLESAHARRSIRHGQASTRRLAPARDGSPSQQPCAQNSPIAAASTGDQWAGAVWNPLAWLSRSVRAYYAVPILAGDGASTWPEHDLEAADGERLRSPPSRGASAAAEMRRIATRVIGTLDDDEEAVDESDAMVAEGDEETAQAATDGAASAAHSEADGALPPRAAATGHTGGDANSFSSSEEASDDSHVDIGAKSKDDDETNNGFDDLPWLLRILTPRDEEARRLLELRQMHFSCGRPMAYSAYGLGHRIGGGPFGY